MVPVPLDVESSGGSVGETDQADGHADLLGQGDVPLTEDDVELHSGPNSVSS